MHQVFISYTSSDSKIAKQVLNALETSHIRCWYAPRDVSPSISYQEGLMSALENSKMLLLILSREALRSIHVKRDVWKAAAAGIAIYPFMIEKADPEQIMEFFWGVCPVFDASSRPLETHIAGMIASINRILDANSGSDDDKGAETSALPFEFVLPGHTPVTHTPEPREWTIQRRLNALSRALYPEAIDMDADIKDYVIYGDGWEERLVRMAQGGFRKIVVYGEKGCGKTSLLNLLRKELRNRGQKTLLWDPHSEVEDGDCYCLSYQVLARLLEHGLVGPEVGSLLRDGLKEGGLWWHGTRKATRFLDQTFNRMRRADLEQEAVILLDNLDANDMNGMVSEVFEEFLDLQSGIFIGAITSTSDRSEWLSNYMVHRIEIPGLSAERLYDVLMRRLNALPFEHSDLVKIDEASCSWLISHFDSNLKKIISACRDALLFHDRLDLDSLIRVTGR